MRSLRELSDMTGRGALVTGAAGHLGGAACEALVELGATVAVCDRDAAGCTTRVAELEAARPGAAVAVPADLADEDDTRRAVRDAVGALGSLDIVVHCAAYLGDTAVAGWAEPFESQTVAAWDAALRVNLTSGFVLAQEARSALEAGGHGSIILVGSIYGHVGPDLRLYEGTQMGNPAGYGASKGGILQLARHLATVLAPEIRVNSVSPGGVERGQPEAFRSRYVERTPLRRMAGEEDVKGAIAYLASDLSAYVTGHDLVVDGGWTAW
jgi:NAD(P)-dependent dehydrogenase (short-subunit alcohol dehydrogenase family)